jgi:hypothetical protein
MAVIYRVTMDVEHVSLILGKGQLGEFATQRVVDNMEDFEEDLSIRYEPKQVKAIEKLVRDISTGKTVTNVSQAKLLLNVLGYKVIDIKVY